MKKARGKIKPYTAPSGGWGSAGGVAGILLKEHSVIEGLRLLPHQNKPDGYACVSCAWAKPAEHRPLEFCENGAKATAWEITSKRADPEFFARHPVAELLQWSDHALEDKGRLTHPLRWDSATDKYRPIGWNAAFAEIGERLRGFDPKSVVFYASGRGSLEAAYIYSLMARMYGSNNLPDCSNMCHESTSVALPESIGVPVGTVTLEDFRAADCVLFFGQNVGSNSPRMLHELQDARKRDVPIVTFNPLRERGLERFVNPQSPYEMLTDASTQVSTQYHQVKAGGDIAAIAGICKALFALEQDKGNSAAVVDREFIEKHTHGFEEFRAAIAGYAWERLEQRSGLTRTAMEAAAAVYARAERVIGVYGMGLTQHREGVEAVQMLVNLLLLRGNIGKRGAGICPVRGHSNVQGQRTVGVTEKPDLVPCDRLAEQYGFQPPRDKGLNTVEACEAIVGGKISAFIGLGGNFVRAVPDRSVIEPAWRKIPLTVQIATKLNRSHLVHGESSYVLPCLGRTEIDLQENRPQAISVEDSTSCIHGSRGFKHPASRALRSEVAIITGIAKATLAPNPKVDWDAWRTDYALIRDAIEQTYQESFSRFNQRMWQPGGFHRPNGARERKWKTATGRANLITPKSLNEDPDMAEDRRDVMRMITLRSNDQFNTTIYGYNDRFRGVHGTRMVVLMNVNDIARMGLRDGEMVTLATYANDGVDRRMRGFRVTAYNIPEGCVGAYYPEANALIPLWHYAERSKVPAAKSVPVLIIPANPARNGSPEGFAAQAPETSGSQPFS